MSTDAYRQIIAASPRDRLDLFLATANRIGAPVGNVEKDFWVCWTLNSLYHERPAGEPRVLFKGGTSLSKGYGLIQRFSEDIDVTVFRDDLDEAASVEELEGLSNKKRRAKLEAIRDACRAYITGPLRDFLTAQLADITNGAGRVELDEADADGQTLLLWYPEVEPRDGAYVRPAIRLESGAKSALDPNRPITITPYVAGEAAGIDLTVADVTTIEATRTFWDKVVIAHGLRRWYERRGELRQEGHACLGTIMTCTVFSNPRPERPRSAISILAPIVCGTHECFSTVPTMTSPQQSRAASRSRPLQRWWTRSRATMPIRRP
jgi:hypothetical protein